MHSASVLVPYQPVAHLHMSVAVPGKQENVEAGNAPEFNTSDDGVLDFDRVCVYKPDGTLLVKVRLCGVTQLAPPRNAFSTPCVRGPGPNVPSQPRRPCDRDGRQRLR